MVLFENFIIFILGMVLQNHVDGMPNTDAETARPTEEVELDPLPSVQDAGPTYEEEQDAAKELSGTSYFWKTQPVTSFLEEVQENTAIQSDDELNKVVTTTLYNLPVGYQWNTLDIDDPLVLKELYNFLNQNYVEDVNAKFRFGYHAEFLKWALQPPGWIKDLQVGIRDLKTKELVGFISGLPATVSIYQKPRRVVEIDYLCVHKRLRKQNITPLLIREITRRVSRKGIFQGVYTAATILTKPVSTTRYWHRLLNPKKLVDVGFLTFGNELTVEEVADRFKLPEEPDMRGFRKLVANDVPKVHELLQEYLKRFDLAPVFTEDEFQHWFIPRPGIIDAYVVEEENNDISGMISSFTFPYTVIDHPVYKSIQTVFSFYYVPGKHRLADLMRNAMILAKKNGADVINTSDMMEYKFVFEELKYNIGDGNLHYYFYNWKSPTIAPQKNGLILF